MESAIFNLTACTAVRKDKRKGRHALPATLVSCTLLSYRASFCWRILISTHPLINSKMTDPKRILAWCLLALLGAAILVGISLRPAVESALDGSDSSVGRRRPEQPFQRTLDFSASPNPTFQGPSNKRLRLKYASAKITVSSGQQPIVKIRTSVDGSIGEYELLMGQGARAVSGSDIYIASQSLSDIFADGGTDIQIFAQTAAGGSFTGSVTLSGSLGDR